MIKMPIACLMILLYAWYYYRRKRRVSLRSTKLFGAMYLIAIVNLITDAITVYTVNNREKVSQLTNYYWHIAFLLSIVAIFFVIYLYLLTYIEKVKKFSKTFKIFNIGVLAMVMMLIIVLPIEYIDTPYGSYSLGPKAYALYAGTIYTMILILYLTLRYWKQLPKSKREAILLSVIIFSVFSLVQIIFPYILITGLAITLITIGILFSNENPDKYIDQRTGVFNMNALEEVTNEQFFLEKKFTLHAITILDSEADDEKQKEILCAINRKSFEVNRMVGYVVSDNTIVFLTFDKRQESKMETMIKQQQHSTILAQYENIKFRNLCLRCPRECDSQEKLMQPLKEYIQHNVSEAAFFDGLTGVYNRNAYEKDIKTISNMEEDIWYLTVDLNNLKPTNDRFGHLVGDELIQAVANTLKDSFEDGATVYRIGGDEFAVIYIGESTKNNMMKQVRNTCDNRNKKRNIKMEFAIGCALYKSGISTWEEVVRQADKAMYREKANMKREMEHVRA